MKSVRKFLEPEEDPKVVYTDNSLEFVEACEDLFWNIVRRPHADPRLTVSPKEQLEE